MNINDMTIGQGKELVAMFGSTQQLGMKPVPFEVGKAYFFRTVTYHFTGRITSIVGDFLVLEEAAWIGDSGRFAYAMKSGKLEEVEPFPQDAPVLLNWTTITDAVEWAHALPLVTHPSK